MITFCVLVCIYVPVFMYWLMPLGNYSVVIKYVDIGNWGDSFMEDLLLLGYENCNWNHRIHKKKKNWHSVILIHLRQN